jgi:hypothetical protein
LDYRTITKVTNHFGVSIIQFFNFILLILSLSFFAHAAENTNRGEEGTDEPAKTQEPAKTAPPPARPIVAAPKPTEYYFNDDADRYFKADEIKPLLAGEQDFYVLFRDDMTGRPKGVALLIPDWGQTATSSRGLDFLRTTLPDYGWVTLSMTAPQSRAQVFNTQLPTEPATAVTEIKVAKPPTPVRYIDEDYMKTYELQLKMRMLALTDEAQNYQGYFIVIAQGSSAAVLASLYAKEELDEPEAMILLDASVPDFKLTEKMNQDITANAVPTLDIYQSRNSRWSRENIKMRRKLARKNFKVSYRTKELHGDISYYNQNQRMLKIVYGWMSSLGL